MSDTTKTPRAHADLAIKFYSDSKMKCWYWRKDSQTWLDVGKPGWEDCEIYEVSETKPTYTPKKRVTMAGITFNAPERERDQNCPACGGSGHVDDATSSAAMDVLAERRRQIEVKGWTPEHDDSHNHGELAHAAGVLALADIKLFLRGAIEYWPWDAPSMEADIIGTSCRTRLIKAAALLLAEIERLDRAAAKKSEARHD